MEPTSPLPRTRVEFITADKVGYTAPRGWEIVGGFPAGETKSRFGDVTLHVGIILRREP